MGRQRNGHWQRRKAALRTPCACLRPGYQGLEEKLSWDKAYAGLIKRDAADHLEQSRTGRTKRGTNTCSPSTFLRELTTYDQDPFSDVDPQAGTTRSWHPRPTDTG